jgi:hypothetical protein
LCSIRQSFDQHPGLQQGGEGLDGEQSATGITAASPHLSLDRSALA